MDAKIPGNPRRRSGTPALLLTLERLKEFYSAAEARPGHLLTIGFKPRWTALTGSGNECGLAAAVPGTGNGITENPLEIIKVRELVGRSLFEVAETCIRSSRSWEKSVGVAALSALSQRFIGCASIRKRGYRAQCWKPEEEFSRRYPAISRVVAADDVVVFAGFCREVRDLAGLCREVHVLDPGPPETYQTILVGNDISQGPPGVTLHPCEEYREVLRSADVVILPASALADTTYAGLAGHAKNARLIGLSGPGCSIIPDAFFSLDVDFITSYRFTDPQQFTMAMIHDSDMEYSARTTQKPFILMRPEAARPGLREGKPGS